MCPGTTIEQQAYVLTHLCKYTDCCPANHISKEQGDERCGRWGR